MTEVSAPAEPLRLNLGCGRFALKGFTNLDHALGTEIYPLTDYADDSVDEIRASHVLEHFPHGEVSNVVNEWVRVLKPGGCLKIAVPSFEWIARKYLDGEDVNIQGFLMGGQMDGDDFHKTVFDKLCLNDAMRAAGLIDIRPWKSNIPDCASYDVSLNLCGRKPPLHPRLNIGCAMSTPRLGFADNFFGWASALMPFGITPTRYEGCFWGQCLERTMTDLAERFDWILTLDYDSFITREQVGAMLILLQEHPEIDALAPLEMSRGRNSSKPLLVMRDETGDVITKANIEDFEKPLLKVETMHFGMTFIRSEKLKKLSHPWFKEEPNAEGTWGEGRIDSDIYFWHRWRDAGFNAHIANRVVIGHAELMITWPDQELNPIHQYPAEFHELGLPENIWQ